MQTTHSSYLATHLQSFHYNRDEVNCYLFGRPEPLILMIMKLAAINQNVRWDSIITPSENGIKYNFCVEESFL